MVDLETSDKWAKEAGLIDSIISLGYKLATPGQIQALLNLAIEHGKQQAMLSMQEPSTPEIQALINHAKNEALERAAQKCDRIAKAGPNCDGYGLSQEIRAMKQDFYK